MHAVHHVLDILLQETVNQVIADPYSILEAPKFRAREPGASDLHHVILHRDYRPVIIRLLGQTGRRVKSLLDVAFVVSSQRRLFCEQA